jgi:hypothetical protein
MSAPRSAPTTEQAGDLERDAIKAQGYAGLRLLSVSAAAENNRCVNRLIMAKLAQTREGQLP